MFIYRFPFGPLATNAVLIGCPATGEGIAIDPSLGSCNAILEKGALLGVSIRKILLTHSHWDHFADAYLLKEKTGAPLYIHPLDSENLKNPGSDRIPLSIPIRPAPADFYLNEGDSIEMGELSLEVIHTPGHSPGGVCFYVKKGALLISGDTLFQGSIGRLDLPTGDPPKMWESLEKLSKLPLETRVIPGHGRETSIGEEGWLPRAKQIFSEY